MKEKKINISRELKLIQKLGFKNTKKSNSIFFLGFANKKIEKDQHLKKYLEIREKLLREIVFILNNYFKSKFDIKFWRILIGPFISFASETFYNRYNSLLLTKKIIKNKKIKFQNIGDINYFDIKNTNEFISLIDDPLWNENVFYIISKDLKIFCEFNKKKIFKKQRKYEFSIKKILNRFLFLPIFFGSKLIINTSLRKIDEIKLQIKLHQFPALNIPDYIGDMDLPFKYDANLRQNLISKNIDKQETKIYSCIKKLVLKSLPIIYLENFQYLSDKIIKNNFTNKLSLIVTSQNFDENEFFKFTAAFSKQKKSKIVYLQHGNTDGVTRYDNYINHMITPDKYLTWGWDKSDLKKNILNQSLNIKKFYNTKVSSYSRFTKKIYYENKLILYGFSPLTRRHFWDVDYINNRYINFEINFLKGIKKEIRENLIYKIHNSNLNSLNDVEKRFFKINSNIKIILKYKNVADCKNKLSIFSYDSTGFYEHLALNKPCIIFMPNMNDELNTFGFNMYFPLFKNNIIFHDEQKMSKFINNNWVNIIDWWYSPKIQTAINTFTVKLSKYDNNYFKKILKYLNKNL